MIIMRVVKVVSVSLPHDIVLRIDQTRDDVPRSRFVLKLIQLGFEQIDK